MMRFLVLAAISAYRRFVSPYKGFCCAYRAHTGRASCSALGWRSVRRFGVVAGLALLRRRVTLCGVAHRRYSPPYRRPFRKQRGDCDIGCDLPCDFSGDSPGAKSCPSLTDLLSCADCGSCDWPNRKKDASAQEQYVHIPPRVGDSQGRRS